MEELDEVVVVVVVDEDIILMPPIIGGYIIGIPIGCIAGIGIIPGIPMPIYGIPPIIGGCMPPIIGA